MKIIDLEERKILQLEMMKEVDSFCRKNNLTYYLAFGTLLGAVRHKGYIPWDDDVDIMMPRKDYEILERYFPFNGKYRFLTRNNTENYPYAYGKLIDIRTIKEEPLRSKYQVIGIDIDIFPIDNYPDNIDEAKEWCQTITLTQRRLNWTFAQFSRGRSPLRTIVKNLIIASFHFLDETGICSVMKLVSKIDKISQKYNVIDTNYCGISSISTYGVRKRNRKEVFKSVIEVDFEGYKFLAPSGYDEYLSDIYGDYMQLPSIEERKTHHISIIYWK